MPGNVPGIGYQPLDAFIDYRDAGSAELVRDGGVIPTTVVRDGTQVVLQLAQPLEQGDYAIRAPGCDAGDIDLIAVRVGATQPLPTRLGSLRVARSGTAYEEFGCSGGRLGFADLAVDLAPEAAPFVEEMRFTTTVDGLPWARSGYGSLESDRSPEWRHQVPPNHVFVDCTIGDAAGAPILGVPKLAPGHHVVEMTAHIAGATGDLPPARIELDLLCDALPPSDAGVEAGANDGETSVGGGGCSCSHADDAPSALLGLVAVAVLARSRRARRST